MSLVTVNPDLAEERRHATFDTERLSHVLYGLSLETRKKMVELALNCKEITNAPNYHYLSREEKCAESLRKTAVLQKLFRDHNVPEENQSYITEVTFPNELSPITVHLMFIKVLQCECTEEQKAKWLKKAQNLGIIGTYAQTELGHGTNVRALETTATYDPLAEEFIMHSPTITSAKFWPGGLGKTANHAVVMAGLYTGGRFHGIHAFLVQLRDMTTHMPLPGVTLGDIGPKFGFETIDNGFLRFNNVRIPRENMLMKNAQVMKDGTFVRLARHDKLLYATMLYIRSVIIPRDAAQGLAQAVTIAIRYSCVRRQSELKPGGSEAQIIDFQTQQYKLFVPLATAYAFWFAGNKMRDAYQQLEQELSSDNTRSLSEFHATVAGLKAFISANTASGIEVCRLACGGHGYSHASGLPKLYVKCTVWCTAEGENTVMLLQTARFLATAYRQATSNTALTGSVAYLSEKLPKTSSLKPCLDIESLINAYKHRATRLVAKACTRLAEVQSRGCEFYDAWNKSSVYFVKAAEAHSQLWILEAFAASITLDGCGRCPAILTVLTDLFKLYATHGISINSGDFTEDGYMSAEQLSAANDGLFTLMERLRPNAVALVDAFDFSDHHLGSVLGRYDGQVYENLYKWAAESPLNATEVHPSHRLLKELEPSKL